MSMHPTNRLITRLRELLPGRTDNQILDYLQLELSAVSDLCVYLDDCAQTDLQRAVETLEADTAR